MRYSNILFKAWNVSSESHKLIWFTFVPSFIGVLVFMFEVFWQYFLLGEEFGVVEDGSMFNTIGNTFDVLANFNLLGWAIFLLIFILIFHFILPAWIHSILILGVRHKFDTPNIRLSLRRKIIDGFDYFFNLFEFKAVLAIFNLTTISLFGLTLYRYFHGSSFFSVMLPILIIYSIIGLLLEMMFIFTPYLIVHEKMSFKLAMKKSFKLVFLNLTQTIGLMLIIFLVNIRIIINVLVVFGVPALITGIITYFAKSDWLNFYIAGGIVIGLASMIFVSYLTAILDVFSIAFWDRALVSIYKKEKKNNI